MTHLILRAALLAAVLLPGGGDGRAAELEVYRNFVRDDGAYRIVVMRMPMSRAFPGQRVGWVEPLRNPSSRLAFI